MATIWRYLRPFHGCHVRRYAAWSLIGFGIIRLTGWPASGTAALTFVPGIVYAALKIVIGIALLATNHERRFGRWGYIATWAALSLSAMALVDALPYLNGAWLYALIVWAMIGEAMSRHEC